MYEPSIADIRLGIIFLGGCGANNARLLVEKLDPKEHPHVNILVANTDAPQLNKHFGSGEKENPVLKRWLETNRFKILQLGVSLTKGQGAGGDPRVGSEAAQENCAELKEFLSGLDAAILVAGLGGGSGSGALPVVANIAKELNLTTLAVVTMPFAFEGGQRSLKANEAREKVMELVPTIVTFNENLLKTEKKVMVRTAFSKINEICLERILSVLREIILEVAEVNLDLADWSRVLGQGKFVQFGFANIASQKVNAEEAAEEILNNPFEDSTIISFAKTILLWFHGDWEVGDTQDVVNRVKHNISRNREDIEVYWGIYANTPDEERWIDMIAVAEDKKEETKTQIVDFLSALDGMKEVQIKDKEEPEPVIRAIQCHVNRMPKTIKVPHTLAQNWYELQKYSVPTDVKSQKAMSRKLREIQKEIHAFSGYMPDPPIKFRDLPGDEIVQFEPPIPN